MDQVLEHIPQDLEALKEVRRVSGHDAVLLLSVPLKGFLARLDNLWMHRNEYHASYTFKQLSLLFLTMRFQVIAEFPYGTFVHYLKLNSFAGTVFIIGRVKK